jgi:guanylate kinase
MMQKNILTIITIVLLTCYTMQATAAFLLIMGPSGTGKSTIINYLKEKDSRFIYISPFTTRKLRDGEKDKIHMSLEEIQKLEQEGKILTINNCYGIYYATPKHMIDEALDNHNFPILDWPIEKLEIMDSHYSNQLYKVYIEPDNFEELTQRLSYDNRDLDGKRCKAGIQELHKLYAGDYDSCIDLRIVNKKNSAKIVAEEIYQKFITFTTQ